MEASSAPPANAKLPAPLVVVASEVSVETVSEAEDAMVQDTRIIRSAKLLRTLQI